MFLNVNGFFVKPLAAEFGWRRGQLGISAAAAVASTLFLPLAGAVADRRGVRILAASGALIFTACYVVLALMPGGYRQYLAIVAVMGLLGGPSTSPFIFARSVVGPFVRSRGFALSISMCGMALSGILILPVLQNIIGTFGWRAGFWFLASISAVFGVVAFKLFGLVPDAPSISTASIADQRASLSRSGDSSFRQALGDPRFWVLAVAMAAGAFAAAVVVSSLQPMLSDSGVAGQTAALLGVWYSVALIAGRLTSGILLDRFAAHVVASVALAAPLCGLSLFLIAGTHLSLWSLGIVFVACGAGAEFDILSYLTARYFGLRTFSALSGVLSGVMGLAFAAGGVISGQTFDRFGNYDRVLIAGIVLSGIAGMGMLISGFIRRA